jgi:hypothetical protein
MGSLAKLTMSLRLIVRYLEQAGRLCHLRKSSQAPDRLQYLRGPRIFLTAEVINPRYPFHQQLAHRQLGHHSRELLRERRERRRPRH